MTDARCLCGRRAHQHTNDEMLVCFEKLVAFAAAGKCLLEQAESYHQFAHAGEARQCDGICSAMFAARKVMGQARRSL